MLRKVKRSPLLRAKGEVRQGSGLRGRWATRASPESCGEVPGVTGQGTRVVLVASNSDCTEKRASKPNKIVPRCRLAQYANHRAPLAPPYPLCGTRSLPARCSISAREPRGPRPRRGGLACNLQIAARSRLGGQSAHGKYSSREKPIGRSSSWTREGYRAPLRTTRRRLPGDAAPLRTLRRDS